MITWSDCTHWSTVKSSASDKGILLHNVRISGQAGSLIRPLTELEMITGDRI